jgi:hypothetical protein
MRIARGFCQQADGAHASFPGETSRFCRWYNEDYNLENHPQHAGPYWPCLAKTKANVCPTFAKLANRYGTHFSHSDSVPFGSPQFSYSMNTVFQQRDSVGRIIPVRRDQIRNPS